MAAMESPWTLQSIQQWATSNFQSDFQALSDHENLRFEPFEMSTNVMEHMNIYKPIDQALLIGRYRTTTDGRDYRVFAIVHSGDAIGYLYRLPSDAYVKISTDRVKEIEFSQPFSLLFAPHFHWSTFNKRLRAVVCFFFLEAGHLPKLYEFSGFLDEFRRACAWVKNEGKDPYEGRKFGRPGLGSRNLTLSNNVPTEHPGDDVSSDDGPVVPLRKRKLEGLKSAQEGTIQRDSKRQQTDASKPFEHHWAELGNAYAQLQSTKEVQDDDLASLRLRVSQLEKDYKDSERKCSQWEKDYKDSERECKKVTRKLMTSRQEARDAQKEVAGAHQREEAANRKMKEAERRATDAKKKVQETELEELKQYKRAKAAEKRLEELTGDASKSKAKI